MTFRTFDLQCKCKQTDNFTEVMKEALKTKYQKHFLESWYEEQ